MTYTWHIKVYTAYIINTWHVRVYTTCTDTHGIYIKTRPQRLMNNYIKQSPIISVLCHSKVT